jgi:hemerythrin
MSATLEQFVIRYKNEGKKVLPEIFDFLENWLVQHLELYDNKYAEYFRKIGVSE